MSGAWIAFWVAVLAPASLYLAKRLIDYLWPPGRHWPLMDRWSLPNEEGEDEGSSGEV
jgi:hypothetical protein